MITPLCTGAVTIAANSPETAIDMIKQVQHIPRIARIEHAWARSDGQRPMDEVKRTALNVIAGHPVAQAQAVGTKTKQSRTRLATFGRR